MSSSYKVRHFLLTAAVLVMLVAAWLCFHNLDAIMTLMKSVTVWLVDTIGKMGYAGIVGLMFLESSFFPFPSEVVLPPSGYLAWKGEMSFMLVIISGIAGSILGALFNYWLAVRFGRPLLEKYGRYFFISPESIAKADHFFARHGHISTLVGRLLPVIRQYISLPAGLARMNLVTFTVFTSIGAGVWTVVLTLIGYLLGEHQEKLQQYLHLITIGCIVVAVLLSVGYLLWYRHRVSKRKVD